MRAVIAGLGALALLLPFATRAQEGEHGSPYSDGNFDDLRSKGPQKPPVPEPIARKKYDAAVEKMFEAADTNRDGTVTLAEFQAVIAARREQAIQERFAAIDTNRDKSISYAEFSAWQRSLGSLALSDSDAGGGSGLVSEEIRIAPGKGREAQIIADLIEPLRTNVIVAANTNYDAGMSLAELIAYEGKRFDALDTNHDGWLTEDEVRAGRGQSAAEPGEAGGRPGGFGGRRGGGEGGGRGEGRRGGF